VRAWLLVVLTGCWSTTPERSKPPPRARVEPPSPRPIPIAVRSARIIVDGATWIDIAIDGHETRAELLCNVALDDALRVRDAHPDAKVAWTCRPSALTRSVKKGALLVQTRAVDESTASQKLADLTVEQWGGEAAHGTTTTYTVLPDQRACVAALDKANAQLAQDRLANQSTILRLRTSDLVRSRAKAAAICNIKSQGAQYAQWCHDAEAHVATLETHLNDPVDWTAPTTVHCE
jgi:hypothetical protein